MNTFSGNTQSHGRKKSGIKVGDMQGSAVNHCRGDLYLRWCIWMQHLENFTSHLHI